MQRIQFIFFILFRAPKDSKFVDDVGNLNAESEEATVGKIKYHARIQWPIVILNLFIHFGSLVGVYYLLTGQPKWQTYVYCKRIHVDENFLEY